MSALDRRVALVTGAGRGIGAALARGFAAEGAAVACLARTATEVEAVAGEIVAGGGRAIPIVADVTDPQALDAAVAASVAAFGGLDIVVANAGVMHRMVPLAELDAVELRQVLDVNLIGVFHTARAAIPALRARGGGHIVVMGSGAGRRAGPGFGPYAASKAAAAMLVRILAQELRADHIAVNEIVPGPVRTVLAGEGVGEPGSRFPPTEWVKTPQDVVPLALFIVTQPTHGPTGQVFSLLGRDG